MIKSNFDKLNDWNDPSKIAYLKDGLALEPGDILVQSDLAKTYHSILDNGIEYFYRKTVR